MITQKNVSRLVNPLRQKSIASEVGVYALHQAAMRLADIHSGRSRLKAKDLVSLLLSHGARTWRNTLPVATVRLSVFSPSGKAAVKIRL